MNTWLRKFFNWIARIYIWLFLDAKYGILVVLTFPFVIFLCWLFLPEWEAIIRISGMLFQFLGLSSVAVGLVGTKKLFGSESLVSKVLLWARHFPNFQEKSKPSVIGNMDATLGSLTCSGHMTTSCPENATLKERMEFLESLVKNIDENQYLINQSVEGNIIEIRNEIKTETIQRTIAENESNLLIQEAVAGNLVIEEVGLIWLFFGILMASSSVEIASLIK